MVSKVTLKQVAARASVSYQTVSKVLNKQTQVSKDTEQRILEAVRELGYRPNQIARNMRAKRSFMIGYSWAQTSPNQVNHILDQFLSSMVQEAEAAGDLAHPRAGLARATRHDEADDEPDRPGPTPVSLRHEAKR